VTAIEYRMNTAEYTISAVVILPEITSGSLLVMSATAAIGMPKLEAGPQKSVRN
jgi:hypothetical protein